MSSCELYKFVERYIKLFFFSGGRYIDNYSNIVKYDQDKSHKIIIGPEFESYRKTKNKL